MHHCVPFLKTGTLASPVVLAAVCVCVWGGGGGHASSILTCNLFIVYVNNFVTFLQFSWGGGGGGGGHASSILTCNLFTVYVNNFVTFLQFS